MTYCADKKLCGGLQCGACKKHELENKIVKESKFMMLYGSEAESFAAGARWALKDLKEYV